MAAWNTNAAKSRPTKERKNEHDTRAAASGGRLGPLVIVRSPTGRCPAQVSTKKQRKATKLTATTAAPGTTLIWLLKLVQAVQAPDISSGDAGIETSPWRAQLGVFLIGGAQRIQSKRRSSRSFLVLTPKPRRQKRSYGAMGCAARFGATRRPHEGKVGATRRPHEGKGGSNVRRYRDWCASLALIWWVILLKSTTVY